MCSKAINSINPACKRLQFIKVYIVITESRVRSPAGGAWGELVYLWVGPVPTGPSL